MAIDPPYRSVYSDIELDAHEGGIIEGFYTDHQAPIPDPIDWINAPPLPSNVLLTSVDKVINWSRRSSVWPCRSTCKAP